VKHDEQPPIKQQKHFITGDESWIFSDNNHHEILTEHRENFSGTAI
jgi:hypothetical protein